MPPRARRCGRIPCDTSRHCRPSPQQSLRLFFSPRPLHNLPFLVVLLLFHTTLRQVTLEITSRPPAYTLPVLPSGERGGGGGRGAPLSRTQSCGRPQAPFASDIRRHGGGSCRRLAFLKGCVGVQIDEGRGTGSSSGVVELAPLTVVENRVNERMITIIPILRLVNSMTLFNPSNDAIYRRDLKNQAM